MKVLLICAFGMSTSLLVNNMKKFAAPEDVIEAYPIAQLENVIDEFDVILVGPQLRYKIKDIKVITDKHHKPCEVIDMMLYGQMKGRETLQAARKLLGEK